jgi:hypothetical protein
LSSRFSASTFFFFLHHQPDARGTFVGRISP